MLQADFVEDFDALDSATQAAVEHRVSWLEEARPDQLIPPGDWSYWFGLCGRGWGKTRTGAEATFDACFSQPETRWAVVSPTYGDCRGVCFEGVSGLLNVIPKSYIGDYNSTNLEIELINYSVIQGFTAEKPDRLRGPNFHGAWCDEIASWPVKRERTKERDADVKSRQQEAWDNLEFALRLGQSPRILITTTPRPQEFVRRLALHPRTFLVRGSTFENAKNLAASALDKLKEVYEGTRKGRQELYAEILEDTEGALWKLAQIDACRLPSLPASEFERIVVAIDPAITATAQSDETGLVAVGRRHGGEISILEDASGKFSPTAWARKAWALVERWNADCIVAEVNQGGDMVEAVLHASVEGKAQLPVGIKKIHARRGKYLRAEPVSALYEKHKVKHRGHFKKLEDQMCKWTGSDDEFSPDRLDAMVYGVTELAIGANGHVLYL